MTEASWLADPTGRHELRYWDGSTWTDHVSDQGVTSVDPVAGAPAVPAAPAAPTAPYDPNATATGAPPYAGAPPGTTFPTTPPAGDPFGGPSYSSTPADYAAAGATPAGKGAPVGIIAAVIALVAVLGVGGWFLFLRDDGDDTAATEDDGGDVDTDASTTTAASGESTTSTTEGTTSSTVATGPEGGEGPGTFGFALATGEAYRHTISLEENEAVRIRAVDAGGADLVLSFTADEADAVEFYRTASTLAPDWFYADDTMDDESVLAFLFPSPGLTLLPGEQVLDNQDAEFEDPESAWFVAPMDMTIQIAVNEFSAGSADDVELVVETQTGVDFADAHNVGTDPFLTGPFFDTGTASPTPTMPDGPNPPTGPPGGQGQIADLLFDQFVTAGMSEAQAQCIVDGLVDIYGDLESIGAQPTPEQTQTISQLTIDCITNS